MLFKSYLKRYLLKGRKNIILDRKSVLNFDVINNSINPEYPCRITDSDCNLTFVNEGCVVSESSTYGNVSLGRFATITGPGTVIKSLKEKIQIGSFSSIGQNVCIVDFNHNFDRVTSCFSNFMIFKENYISDLGSTGSVVIEEDVWIGSNSVILPGIKIGRGSVIGAGSIVTKDIPAYSIAVGNPAKVVSQRFEQPVIAQLEELKWWEWDIEKILKNKDVFNINLNKSNDLELNSVLKEVKN